MSQIQTFVQGMGPGGPILTLTGDTGGAVGPDGAGNINVQGETFANETGFATVSGDAGTNTLSVQPLFDTIPTNDATATNFLLARFAIDPSSAVIMTANVIGNRDDYTAACGGFTTGVARREAVGGAILVGSNTIASEDGAGGVPQFGIQLDGNDIVVYAQGLAGQDWRWTCTYQYQKQVL